jgi:molecular chaperone DnaJ
VSAEQPDYDQIFESFGDIFGNFFGQPAGELSLDLGHELEISFAESMSGCIKSIKVDRVSPCAPCYGTGFRARSDAAMCSQCEGRGAIERKQGFFSIVTTCPGCADPRERCRDCDGAGYTDIKHEELNVTVPAGVSPGSHLRLAGKGAIRGEESGDLYVTIDVAADSTYRRDGADLHMNYELSASAARDGGKVMVPTLAGLREVAFKPGTRTGDVTRLRGFGAPKMPATMAPPFPGASGSPYREADSERGDLVVHFNVARLQLGWYAALAFVVVLVITASLWF